ncbi:hypothetical protein ACIBO1_19750 [Micromonospora sp. NPDC049903]|uniref:hypothetical protein n=1 Tax=Micromonospora sp. NPDC049903 TaxID=3364276 RepID=UPI003797E41D
MLVVVDLVSVALFGGLVPGFLLGLFAFRVKSRWCPHCGGSTMSSPPPAGRQP